MSSIATAVGLLSSGLASGLALSYPVVVNPLFLSKSEALNGGSDAHRLNIWHAAYKRGFASIPSLATVAATLLSLGNYYSGTASAYRYIAAGLHFSIIPFTGLFMLSTVFRLEHLDDTRGADAAPGEVDSLLPKWANLHLVRVALTVSAFGLVVADTFGLLA